MKRRAWGATIERRGPISDRSIACASANEVRSVVLGHLLRGGGPTANDALLSLRFGAVVVCALEAGLSNVMVSLEPSTVRYVPLKECVDRVKFGVLLDGDTILTAYDLGIEMEAEPLSSL